MMVKTEVDYGKKAPTILNRPYDKFPRGLFQALQTTEDRVATLQTMPWSAAKLQLPRKLDSKGSGEARKQAGYIHSQATNGSAPRRSAHKAPEKWLGGTDMKRKTLLVLLGNTASGSALWPWHPAAGCLRLVQPL